MPQPQPVVAEEQVDVSESNRPHYSVVAFAANGQAYGYLELVCDTAKEISELPTSKESIAVGSKCNCIENGKTYILNNAREWVENVSEESGDSASGGASIVHATFEGSGANYTCDKTFDEMNTADLVIGHANGHCFIMTELNGDSFLGDTCQVVKNWSTNKYYVNYKQYQVFDGGQVSVIEQNYQS
jgi:hypothetical protein